MLTRLHGLIDCYDVLRRAVDARKATRKVAEGSRHGCVYFVRIDKCCAFACYGDVASALDIVTNHPLRHTIHWPSDFVNSRYCEAPSDSFVTPRNRRSQEFHLLCALHRLDT